MRFDLDKRVELALAIDNATLKDLERFDVEAFATAAQPYLSQQAIAAFRKRYAYLMGYVKSIEHFPERELRDPYGERVEKFMASPSTNYIGRDRNFVTYDD